MTVDVGRLGKGLKQLAKKTWCPHTPTPKQAEFLQCTGLEVLYGGAAGGGKSDALLMAALQYVDVPNYSAIIFRRTFAELALPGAIMARSLEWLTGTAAKWDSKNHRWTFPSGATLQFAYLDAEKDRYRYQSAEFQFIGWDELTAFPEGSYKYLLSRLRRGKTSDVPLRVRAATNPGGEGHEWVKERFIDNPKERKFISARLTDNPHLDQESYRESLAQLDSITRRQLEMGEWVQDASGLIYRPVSGTWRSEHPGKLDNYILAADFGVVDQNAFAVLGWRRHDRTVWILECYTFTGSPSDVGEEMARLCGTYRFDAIVGDIGGLGKGYQVEIERRFGIPIDAAEKQNKLGYQRLLNGALERGELVAYAPKCSDLRDEWAALQRTKGGKENQSQANHASDATLYGYRCAGAYAERDKPRKATREEVLAKEEAELIASLNGEHEHDPESDYLGMYESLWADDF